MTPSSDSRPHGKWALGGRDTDSPQASYDGPPREVDSAKVFVKQALLAVDNGDIAVLLGAQFVGAMSLLRLHREQCESLRGHQFRVSCRKKPFDRNASLVIDRLTQEIEFLSELLEVAHIRISELEAMPWSA